MKKLLATTALVVGIGFSAQASDPNATLDQIAEIVAAHYVEENAALEAENTALETAHQNISDLANELEARLAEAEGFESFTTDNPITGSTITVTSDNVESFIHHLSERIEWHIERYEELEGWYDASNDEIRRWWDETQVQEITIIYLQEQIAELEELANNLEQQAADYQAESEIIQEWANYEITVREAQIAELEEEVTAIQTELNSIEVFEPFTFTDAWSGWTVEVTTDNYQEVLEEYNVRTVDSLIAQYEAQNELVATQADLNTAQTELNNAYETVAEVEAWAVDTVGQLEAQLAEANAATAAAQAEAQEASNRANVNAQNATAWYEEAQRLQALLDAQD